MSRRQSDSESGEDAPFLDNEKGRSLREEAEEALSGRPRSRNRWSRCTHISIVLAHVLFFAINILWSTTNVVYDSKHRSARGSIYEPSDAPYSEKYTEYSLPLGQKSPFTTFDRAIADEAWESISMKQGLGWLKVSQEKVDLMDQSSVEFNDQSGYFFGMDVFHQLHCLNYLRKKSILYNHLYPAGSEIEDEQVPPEFHIPHCIDSIRLSLQCHADLSLIPQRWADGWLEPWAVWTNKHTCRNFDAIREWALQSTPGTTGKLEHPELGTVVSGRLNLSALPIWQEVHDTDVVPGNMPVCHSHS